MCLLKKDHTPNQKRICTNRKSSRINSGGQVQILNVWVIVNIFEYGSMECLMVGYIGRG